MTDKFRWIGRSTVTRSKVGSAGVPLEHDHIYDMAAFAESVVAEWIATGNAEAVAVKPQDTTLCVKSVTVKTKAPKLGAEL